MDRHQFCEQLLSVMERKTHWAWPAFTEGMVEKPRLEVHLQQEYEVYVRDFPILMGWVYAKCPVVEVRRELIENIYEEETGGISAGKPHPELFLEYPMGLGFDLKNFENIVLLNEAAAYRGYLDHCTQARSWPVGLAVTTLFLEGTPYERGEVDDASPKRPQSPLKDHPLVKHYGLPLKHLALTKAHREVEGEHRQSAWACVLDGTPEKERAEVISAMEETLARWQTYRDGVANACGIFQDETGKPKRAL